MRSFAFALVLLLAPSAIPAQSFTRTHEQQNLSPAATRTLDTLKTLNALPAEQWRFHAGDLPHGEASNLDDAAWPLVSPHSKAPNEAVWYRREIVVPTTLHGYDISGSTISFQFRADANGSVPEIIYFNGRRVALGEDLEPITLFEPARPGDKILVAVKLLHTVDEKTFSGVSLTIEPGARTRINPKDIRLQCLTAANLLTSLPTPRPDLLPKLESAIAAVNLKALQAGNQAIFDASLKRSQQILAALHPTLAQAKIDLAGNSHIDAAWLWPRSETIDVVRRTFTTALQLMNEYPDYTFTQSAAQYSEWMADKYPALNDQIRQRIKEGRWEIVGGMWVEPDLNLPDGESLVRQLLVGQRYFQKEYGVQARIGWNPDSFGYNWQLPQIYKRSGLDYFVTQKMHWNDTNILPFRLFWWESPDGSKVLTYFPTDYVHDNLSPARLSADFAESAERNPGTTEMLDLYGIGDHGGGPTRAMLDEGDHWIKASHSPTSAVPSMHYATAQSYFSSVETRLNPDSPTWDYKSIAKGYTAPPASASGGVGLPTWKDELYFEYHRGIFTSQAKHKEANRRSEVATLDAEKLASLAWLNGGPYPADALTESWKQITFNQFHDLAAGSGIAVIYRDAQKDYAQVFHSDREITEDSLKTLALRIDTHVKGDVPILLYNSLAWPRSETVKLHVQMPEQTDSVAIMDARNKPLATQVLGHDDATHAFDLLVHVEDIPALGYEVLHAVSGRSNTPKKPLSLDQDASSFTLSNSRLKLTLDKQSGCITSLTDAAHTEYIAPHACANQLQTFVDTPKQYDAWNIDPGTLDHNTPITALDSITVLEQSPLRNTVRIVRTWQSSKFTQDISLDAEADSILVDNTIDWHESHVLLKAAFPLAATGNHATYEIPYGSIERPTTRDNSWEKAQFEVPALRWADLGDDNHGVSILNDSKYGYDALDNTLRLTLLRSPTWPDPDADRGLQHFRYGIYPHTGSWKQAFTVRRGYELNDPLTATQVSSHTGFQPSEQSLVSIENPNVTLTAVKKAEDANGLIFRMYEWAGTPAEVKLHIPHGATAAVESNLMEKPEGAPLPLEGDLVKVPIKPYEILTVLVSYPQQAMQPRP